MDAQSAALGPFPPKCVWHLRYTSMHPPPVPSAIHQEDEEQSYEEFVEMGDREPNAEGTGRVTPCATRKKIGIMPILLVGEDDAPNKDLVDSLQKLLSAHTGLETEIVRPLELQWNGEWSIVDEMQGIAFPLADLRDLWKCPDHIRRIDSSKGRRRSKQCTSNDAPIDVFAVLKVLEEYVSNSHFALIAFGALPLAENVAHTDGDGNIEIEEASAVLGRACGARVAVVSTREVPHRTVLCTALHEFYHTAGFDHCVVWRCLMNSQWHGEDENQVALAFAPHNLRKLLCMLRISEQEQDSWVLERYKRLLNVVASMGTEFRADRTWLRGKIHAVRAVTGL